MPFCSNCGNPVDAGDRFCSNCGTPVQAVTVTPVTTTTAPVAQAAASGARNDYRIVLISRGTCKRAVAIDILSDLLGYDDDLTLGGVNALQEAGMTDVQVYSITGQKEALTAIKEGKMTLTAHYTTVETADIVASALDSIVAGEEVGDYYKYITVTNITSENVEGVEGEF